METPIVAWVLNASPALAPVNTLLLAVGIVWLGVLQRRVVKVEHNGFISKYTGGTADDRMDRIEKKLDALHRRQDGDHDFITEIRVELRGMIGRVSDKLTRATGIE